MTSTTVVVFATFRPKPGRQDDLRVLLDGMARNTRHEPGNELYNLYSSGDEDTRGFHLLERYTSPAALDAHRAADYYKAYRAELPDLLTTPVEVLVLDPVDVQSDA